MVMNLIPLKTYFLARVE